MSRALELAWHQASARDAGSWGSGRASPRFRDGVVRGRPFFTFAVTPFHGAFRRRLLLSLSPHFVVQFIRCRPFRFCFRCRLASWSTSLSPFSHSLSPRFVVRCVVASSRFFRCRPYSSRLILFVWVFFCFFCQLFLFFYNASFLSNKVFHTYCTTRTSL